MSNTRRYFRLRVHNAGTTTPSAGTVDYTLQTERASIIAVGRQTIDILEGRSVSDPSVIDMVDENGTITAQLANAGRMETLMRLAEWQDSTDGTTWTTLQIGRITRAKLLSREKRTIFRITLSDERVIERQTRVWETVSTDTSWPYVGSFLVPPALDQVSITPITYYGEFETPVIESKAVTPTQSGNLRRVLIAVSFQRLGMTNGRQWTHAHTVSAGVEMIKSDLKAEDEIQYGTSVTQGNFRKLRYRAGTFGSYTNYEVYGFGHDLPEENADDLVNVLDGLGTDFSVIECWIVDTGSSASNAGILWMPDEEPTQTAPVFVGGRDGINPHTNARKLYQDKGVRIDTSAFTTLENDEFYDPVRYRVTAPENTEVWLRENYYKPFLIAPFIDSQGRVAPKSLRLQQDVDPSTLFAFTASNIIEFNWDHGAQDLVTGLDIIYTDERNRFIDREAQSVGIIEQVDRTLPFEHDKQTELTERRRTIRLDGFHTRGGVTNLPGGGELAWGAIRWGKFLAREIFDRFGDGPIEIEFEALLSTDQSGTEPGEWVTFTHPALPDPEDGQLNGDRVIQITSKEQRMDRIAYTAIDGGPNAQPLSAPTVSAAQNTNNPNHAIDVTLSNTSGNGWFLQIQEDVTGASWYAADQGDGNTTVTIGNLPSGKTWNFRAFASAPGRIRSAWSTEDSASTASLTAPSFASGEGAAVTDHTATVTWTNGESNYGVELSIDDAACASASYTNSIRLPAGTTKHTFTDLDASTTHCVRVRHFDPFGGVSSAVTDEFTTSTSTTAPDITDIFAFGGDIRPTAGLTTSGIRVFITPGDRSFGIEAQRADDSGGSPGTWETIRYLPAGEATFYDTRAEGTTWHYRARHFKTGYTDGAWSSSVSATAAIPTITPDPNAALIDTLEASRRINTHHVTDGIIKSETSFIGDDTPNVGLRYDASGDFIELFGGTLIVGDPGATYEVHLLASNYDSGGNVNTSVQVDLEPDNNLIRLAGMLGVDVFSDATRPSAGTAGRVIFNSTDGNLNIDDGTNWILPDGTTT